MAFYFLPEATNTDLKEEFTKKINYWRFPHPQASQDLDSFFIKGTDFEKLSITSLAQQWILCSEWVPSERVQTADKNITVIHTTPFPQLTSYEVKSCMFIRNKSIIKTFLLQTISLKYESPVYNITFSSGKVVSSELRENTQKPSKTVLNKYVVFWFERITLDKTLLWTMDSYLRWKWCISFFTNSFSLHKMFTDGLEWCGLLVDYCDVLISCLDSFWRHPFTAEDLNCFILHSEICQIMDLKRRCLSALKILLTQ